jgi:hypothetical protein
MGAKGIFELDLSGPTRVKGTLNARSAVEEAAEDGTDGLIALYYGVIELRE